MDLKNLLPSYWSSAYPVPDIKFDSVTIDSRTAGPGTLFCPLKGRNDGHDYIEDAIKNGAAAALVEEDYLLKNPGLAAYPLLVCSDSLNTLQLIASEKAARSGAEIIGITGSVGKTSTRELLSRMLSTKYRVYQSIKNYNNHIGYPLSILNMPEDTQYAVLELGANHIGEIARLCAIAPPKYAIITRIAEVHIEGFGSLENVKQAKYEIFDHAAEDAILFVNMDDPLIRQYPSGNKIQIKYGRRDSSDIKFSVNTAGNYPLISHAGISFPLPLSNPALLENALSALAAALTLNVPADALKKILNSYELPEGRGKSIVVNGIRIINDAYNASPVSLLNALEYFHHISCEGRRFFVFGDMLELGEISREAHKKAGEDLAAAEIDALYCYGPDARITAESARQKGLISSRHFHSREIIAETLAAALKAGDCLMLKASRGMALEEITKILISKIDIVSGEEKGEGKN